MFEILIKDMDSFEINKIIASILLTALIIIGIGKLVDVLFYVEKPKISAYKVEGIDQIASDKETSSKSAKVVGRTAGAVDNYNYSKAMKAYAKVWSFEEMNSYLIKPQAYIKGTKMAFAGLRKEKDRASVILYMNSKSASPQALP